MSIAIKKENDTPLDLALAYAAHGWPLFPCRAADEETDEHDPLTGEIIVLKPKTPLTTNGLHGATRNQALIKRFWAKFPDAMVGVPTGHAIGAFVLDVDIKTKDDGTVINGHESLAALEDKYGPLPETATVTTPRGGRHLYFKHVPGFKNTADKIAPGLDTRAEGGFVVAAGSRMADGRGYDWLDWEGVDVPPIADAPAWLVEMLTPPVHVPRPASTFTYQPSNDNEPYVNAAVVAELSNLAAIGQGGRGEALNRAAFSLGTLVGANALSRHEAEAGLYSAAAANGVLAKDGEKSTLARIKRGLDAGSRQPRAVPERSGDDTPIVGLGRLVKTAATSISADIKADSVQDTASPAPTEPPATEPPPVFVATPYEFKNPKTLARREFAFGTHYIRKYVSVTVSPGGIGKTSNSIVEALSMVSGKDLTGIKPSARLRCWLFNAEDPRDEMERRIQAACLHYKLKPDDINGHLFLDTGREQDLVVAIDDKRAGTKIQVPIVEAVIRQILTHKIDVMIVDPFVSTHAVNENDNGAIDKVAKLWAQIADDTNCSIDIVHHLRKIADREATVEDARGAVSLIGAARSVRVLNRMSEEQATAAGVPVQERFSYFNIHQGKANLTKMSTSQDWRRLESVPLGNGTTWKPQDFAGVVTEWKWPGSEEIAEGVTQEQRERIASLLAGQSYKAAKQAKEAWAGFAVMAAMDLDADDKASAAIAGGVLKALLKEGFLTIDERRDERSRTLQKFVVAVR